MPNPLLGLVRAMSWPKPELGNRKALWVLEIMLREPMMRKGSAWGCELGLKNGGFRLKRRILQVVFMVDLLKNLTVFMTNSLMS